MIKIIVVGVVSLMLLSSCGKFFRKAQIDRDCTGTYLQLNGRDYLVCNPSSVNLYPSGSSIKVKYKSLNDCTLNSDGFMCEKLHKSYGFVEVTEIKPN